MTTSSTSYLKTLPNDEATTFIASLQKVKTHLSQELQWMSDQVHQKTIQLQSIETLLSEAAELGLTPPDASVKPTATEAKPPAVADDVTSNGNNSDVLRGDLKAPAAADKAIPLSESVESAPAEPASAPQSSKQRKSSNAKTKRPLKSASKRTAPPKSAKHRQPSENSEFRSFVQREFQDKSITESVGEIIDRAPAPIGAKDVMAQLYKGLSEEDYQRAKNSVTNVLSVGKSKGRWLSPGRGLYASHAVATA